MKKETQKQLYDFFEYANSYLTKNLNNRKEYAENEIQKELSKDEVSISKLRSWVERIEHITTLLGENDHNFDILVEKLRRLSLLRTELSKILCQENAEEME